MPRADTLPLSSAIFTNDDHDDDSSDDDVSESSENHSEDLFHAEHHAQDDGRPTEEDADSDSDDNPDRRFVADMLRNVDIDWLQHPEYASHRLIVLPDPDPSPSTPLYSVPQHFWIMAQFVTPASAVFRDVILGVASATAADPLNEDPHERLACLQRVPESDADLAGFPARPRSQPLPDDSAPPSFLESSRLGVSEHADDSLLPLLQLHLSFPEHFPALLKVMYDDDLDAWEQDSFQPDTIGPITENVSRLECSSDLIMRCLQYFCSIKSTLSTEQTESVSMEALRKLHDRAVQAGLLPAGP